MAVSYKPSTDKRLDIALASDRMVLPPDGQLPQSAQQNANISRQCTRTLDRNFHHALEGLRFDMPAFALLLSNKTLDGLSAPIGMEGIEVNQPLYRG